MIDRILYGGNLITLDSSNPRASALAISGERIIAIGSDDEILPLAALRTARDNLRGRTVILGLTDAHIHWCMTAQALHDVNVFEVPRKAIALERVAERVVHTPPGEWIYGHGWVQDFWPDRAFLLRRPRRSCAEPSGLLAAKSAMPSGSTAPPCACAGFLPGRRIRTAGRLGAMLRVSRPESCLKTPSGWSRITFRGSLRTESQTR
jgi:hypothetical protein